MATAVRVEAAVPGRRRAGTAEHPLDIEVSVGATVPLRQLIDAVVRAEVRAFEARAIERTFVRVLTERSLAEGLEQGAVRSGGIETDAHVDVDAAVAVALLAHQDGLYQVAVDDEPVDDLEAPVTLRENSRLLFLRLVPLAGG